MDSHLDQPGAEGRAAPRRTSPSRRPRPTSPSRTASSPIRKGPSRASPRRPRGAAALVEAPAAAPPPARLSFDEGVILRPRRPQHRLGDHERARLRRGRRQRGRQDARLRWSRERRASGRARTEARGSCRSSTSSRSSRIGHHHRPARVRGRSGSAPGRPGRATPSPSATASTSPRCRRDLAHMGLPESERIARILVHPKNSNLVLRLRHREALERQQGPGRVPHVGIVRSMGQALASRRGVACYLRSGPVLPSFVSCGTRPGPCSLSIASRCTQALDQVQFGCTRHPAPIRSGLRQAHVRPGLAGIGGLVRCRRRSETELRVQVSPVPTQTVADRAGRW